mmetsp:Transcript_55187/g.121052  ORF Transcript_55187/g.121052 Transcript_55187/m.121052 type:complete len:342 (-) Transcript_55187:2-1027(-)
MIIIRPWVRFRGDAQQRLTPLLSARQLLCRPCATMLLPRERAGGIPEVRTSDLRHLPSVLLQELHGSGLLVHRSNSHRRLPLGVGLVHARPGLNQVLEELLAAVACSVVEATIACGIHGEGVGPLVEQHLYHGDLVGPDGVAERGDAPLVLCIEGLSLGDVLLNSLQVAHLRGLVHVERCFIDLLQGGLQFLRQAAHPLADLQHQLLILVVLHCRLHTVLLNILENVRQLWVLLQSLHALPDWGLAAVELGVVVLGNGLRLQPTAHGLGILGELLQGLGHVGVAGQVRPHFGPRGIVHTRHACKTHGGAVVELDGLGLIRGGRHLCCEEGRGVARDLRSKS